MHPLLESTSQPGDGLRLDRCRERASVCHPVLECISVFLSRCRAQGQLSPIHYRTFRLIAQSSRPRHHRAGLRVTMDLPQDHSVLEPCAFGYRGLGSFPVGEFKGPRMSRSGDTG
jgi:hypothetical protein